MPQSSKSQDLSTRDLLVVWYLSAQKLDYAKGLHKLDYALQMPAAGDNTFRELKKIREQRIGQGLPVDAFHSPEELAHYGVTLPGIEAKSDKASPSTSKPKEITPGMRADASRLYMQAINHGYDHETGKPDYDDYETLAIWMTDCQRLEAKYQSEIPAEEKAMNTKPEKAMTGPERGEKANPDKSTMAKPENAGEAKPEAGQAIPFAEPDQTQPDRNHDFQTELAALVEAIPAVPSPAPKQQAGQDSKTDNAPVTYSLGEYLNLKFEPKIPLLGSDQRKAVLRSKEILMIYSYRGTGKTRFANMLACCLAGNTQFLKWPIGKPDIKVLYIDGELDAEEQQERWPQAVKAAGCDIETVTSNLHVTNKHVQKKLYIPDLNTTEGRNWILQASKGFDVVFYDSMAAFFPRGSRDWDTAAELMNKTLEDVRNINGCAQVILQHEGKGGSQIGSVQNERNVAISWRLREIQNDSESHNHIELTFEKRRNLQRQDAEGLDIVFAGDSWQWKPLTQERDARVIQAYLELNMTQSEIAREEGINQSTVGRILKKAGIDPKKGRR